MVVQHSVTPEGVHKYLSIHIGALVCMDMDIEVMDAWYPKCNTQTINLIRATLRKSSEKDFQRKYLSPRILKTERNNI